MADIVLLAKLDITKNKQIMEEFEFDQFPIFVLFDENDQMYFEEEPTSEALVNWIQTVLSQPFTVIESADQFVKELQVEEFAKIFYYGDTDT